MLINIYIFNSLRILLNNININKIKNDYKLVLNSSPYLEKKLAHLTNDLIVIFIAIKLCENLKSNFLLQQLLTSASTKTVNNNILFLIHASPNIDLNTVTSQTFLQFINEIATLKFIKENDKVIKSATLEILDYHFTYKNNDYKKRTLYKLPKLGKNESEKYLITNLTIIFKLIEIK